MEGPPEPWTLDRLVPSGPATSVSLPGAQGFRRDFRAFWVSKRRVTAVSSPTPPGAGVIGSADGHPRLVGMSTRGVRPRTLRRTGASNARRSASPPWTDGSARRTQSLWWPADRRVSPFRARPTGAPAPPPVALFPWNAARERNPRKPHQPAELTSSPRAGLAAVPQPLQRQELEDALQHPSSLNRLQAHYPMRRERTHASREEAAPGHWDSRLMGLRFWVP
jgi:hypothetical protein